MKLPKSLTTVTTFSKLLAIILFITFPFVGFLLGISYQSYLPSRTAVEKSSTVKKAMVTVAPTLIPTVIISQANTANGWKTITTSAISFQIPQSWTVSRQDRTYQISSPDIGKPPMIISFLNREDYKNETDKILDAFQFNFPPNVKNISIGGLNGADYYGCIGIEGCIDEDFILLNDDSHAKLYAIFYTHYPDDINTFNTIFSTISFRGK